MLKIFDHERNTTRQPLSFMYAIGAMKLKDLYTFSTVCLFMSGA